METVWCIFEPTGFRRVVFVSFPGFPGYCEVGAAHTLCFVSFPGFFGYCEVDAAHTMRFVSFPGVPGYCVVDAAHIVCFVSFPGHPGYCELMPRKSCVLCCLCRCGIVSWSFRFREGEAGPRLLVTWELVGFVV